MTVAISTVDSLYQLAGEMLQACATLLESTVGGVPDSVSVWPGPPAVRCEMLAVHVGGLGEETTAPINPIPQTGMRATRGRVNLATIVVTTARCIPIENDGSVELANLEGVSRKVYQDGWALWNGIAKLIRENDTPFLARCKITHFDNGVPLATSGGYAGWVFTFRPSLDGIPDDTWP